MGSISPLQTSNLNLENVAKFAQKCVQSNPVVVLGSGASVPHQIRSMGALADHLRDAIATDDHEQSEAWAQVLAALAQDVGLEAALQRTTVPPKLLQEIVNLTWKAVASDDLSVLQRVVSGTEIFPLSDLYKVLFRSTNKIVNVVTPNYDRIAEYAADVSGFIHSTGFVPGIIRQREGVEPIRVWRANQLSRTVKIWKVHGSIDWFHNSEAMVISLPLSNTLPDNHLPCIVTPGVSKYERTHDEPFRSALHGADLVLSSASAFLCIGYGFRDTHIEPKLVERCRQKNVPIVVLAKTLTPEARAFLSRNAGSAYMAFEACQDGTGTQIFCPEAPNGQVLSGFHLWSFQEFNDLIR